ARSSTAARVRSPRSRRPSVLVIRPLYPHDRSVIFPYDRAFCFERVPMSTIQSLFRFADRISPFLAGRLAEPFFFHLGRRRPVQPGEREVLDEAERDVLDFE